MSERQLIRDDQVAAVLDRVVWVVDPMLELVVAADPVGLKARTKRVPSAEAGIVGRTMDGAAWVLNLVDFPGTRGWEELPPTGRARWWVHRAGALNTVLVAAPGVFGVLARRLPLQDVLGFANQAIVLCAVARESGVHDREEKVELLAFVLCGRDVRAIALTTPGAEIDTPNTSAWAPTAMLGGLWRTAQLVRGMNDELDKRPRPNRFFRLVAMAPGVGVIGNYLGEYGALARAAKSGQRWLATATVRERSSLGHTE